MMGISRKEANECKGKVNCQSLLTFYQTIRFHPRFSDWKIFFSGGIIFFNPKE